MKFVVAIWVTDSFIEPDFIGPFPNHEWAKRYIDRVIKHHYYRVEIKPMLSPRLIDPRREGDSVVFDPDKGIDR